MRLRSDIYVSALLRRVFATGGFAAIEKKGAEEAGAIFVRQRFRDGSQSLYGPAPQSFFEDGERDSRLFELRLDHCDEEALAQLLARERSFDPDIWVVEIETDTIPAFLPLVASAP